MRWRVRTGWRRGVVLAGAMALGASARNVEAQPSVDSVRHHGAPPALFTRRDAITLGAFGIAAGITFPNDRHLARAFQRDAVQENGMLRNAAAFFRATGQPGVLVGSVSAWALGRLTKRPMLAATGLHVTEAIVVAGGLTVAGKIAAGRARPSESGDDDPYDLRWWRGTRQGYTSMPSGHTSAAFAAASALAGDWRQFSPRSARFVVPALYAGATMVGLSRMYNDRHWASDVLVGAALGTVTGSVVGRWGRAHAGNRLQRWLAPIAVQPDGGTGLGLRLSMSRTW